MIAFRCDGDLRVGAGHVARSLQLALAFRAAGVPVVCVGKYTGIAAELLAAGGVPTTEPEQNHPLGVPAGITAAVVDSYELAEDDIVAARGSFPVAAVVDEGRAPAVDAVLSYHLDAQRRIEVPHGTVAVLGADYAPVRPDVVAARRGRGFARALVAVGGGHAGLQLAEDAARQLLEFGPALEIFVAAPGPPRVDDSRVTCGIAHGGLAERIAWADLAVSAAGSTPYDLACAGVPAALYPVAANQMPIRDAFVACGLAARDVAELADRAVRDALAAAGPSVIDGYGAFRARDAIAAALAGHDLPGVLRFRPATESDADRLLAWRNDPDVRAMSRSSEVIARDSHLAWLGRVLVDPDRTLLVVERERIPIGTVRFDRCDRAAEISVALAPEARGAGLGVQVLREATELQLASYPALEHVLAEVQRRNLRSLRAFERAGYAPAVEQQAPDSILLVRARARETPNSLAQEQR